MLKKILLTLLVILLLVAAGGYFYIQHLKPTYSGELTLKGLTGEVEIFLDDYGIPHIYAQSEEDAYMALGYVHAQDRLFQMEVVRRIAPGRLSEIFGKDMVKTDKFFRTLGINEYSKKSVEKFNAEAEGKIKKTTSAYLKGVNRFVASGQTPIEFTILGIEKTPFTLIDINNAIGYMGFSFGSAQRVEPILTKIQQELGVDYLNALDLGLSEKTLPLKNYPKTNAETALSEYASEVMENLPAAIWTGSNSWVLGPEKTKSGKVILENDPHVGFSQPAVWYEAHLEAPGFSFYGYHIAGVPFGVFGHSRQYATGLTMFTNDDIDFFQEKISPNNPDQYEHKGELKNIETREETIIVKDSSDVTMKVRSTVHGPIVNDVLDLKQDPISMYWTFTQTTGPILEILHRINHLKSIEEAREVASAIHAPGLNLMYGDAAGNIGWWASAKIIHRADSAQSVLFNDGASGKYDPIGFYDFTENPQAENPPWNYVYSANNQTRLNSGQLYPGHYAPENRARRIVSLLGEKEKFDAGEMKQMALDVTSENVPEVVISIMEAIGEDKRLSEVSKKALKILNSWDGSFFATDNAPVIYNKWIYKILAEAMEDELGEKDFDELFSTHMIQRSFQPLFANDSTVWWDNKSTKGTKESRADIFVAAINEGMEELENQLGSDIDKWEWGKVHTLEHNHPFGKVEALRKFFNVGPFEVDGSNMVINNLKFHFNGTGRYEVNAGPSTRRIVDFSDVENNSWGILPTGNSGNPFSKHYDDQAEMYATGQYRKQLMNEAEIRKSAPNKLVLKPIQE